MKKLVLLLTISLLCFGFANLAKAEPNDTFFQYQYPLQEIKAQKAWSEARLKEKHEVIVAVIDEGVDKNHSELKNKIWINSDEKPNNYKDDDGNGYIDDYKGYNFVYDTSFNQPFGDHGTMISGIIAADKNNNEGIVGLSQHTKIMPLTACNGSTCYKDSVQEAIRYAANMNADIINLSLTGPTLSYSEEQDYKEAIEYANKKGVIIVAAAGNGFRTTGEGKNLNIFSNSPICEDNQNNIIGVTSVNYNLQKSTFADYGSKCVDIAAPGETIISTSLSHFSSYGVPYNISRGTSFSAAYVTGAIAFLKSIDPGLGTKEVISLLNKTSSDLNYKHPGYIGELGSGLINLHKATEDKIR
ncbi:MAG: S8 family serine peptidase [Candidatus Magasanikbacteria bacterium]